MRGAATEERSSLLSKVYDDPKYNAAFDRCVDVMARLLQKYGPQVLEQMEDAAENDCMLSMKKTMISAPVCQEFNKAA